MTAGEVVQHDGDTLKEMVSHDLGQVPGPIDAMVASHEAYDGLRFDRRGPHGRLVLRSIWRAMAACAENHGRQRSRRFEAAGGR